MFSKNILDFQKSTGATICTVFFYERSNGSLQNGLSQFGFMKKLRETIEEENRRITIAKKQQSSQSFLASSTTVEISTAKPTDFLCLECLEQEKTVR